MDVESGRRLVCLSPLGMYGAQSYKHLFPLQIFTFNLIHSNSLTNLTFLKNRDTIQVKTHAQVLLKKLDDGEDIFEELDMLQNIASSEPPKHTLALASGMHHRREWMVALFRPDEIDAAKALVLLHQRCIYM